MPIRKSVYPMKVNRPTKNVPYSHLWLALNCLLTSYIWQSQVEIKHYSYQFLTTFFDVHVFVTMS